MAAATCFLVLAGSAVAALVWPAETALVLCLSMLPATGVTLAFLALSTPTGADRSGKGVKAW
ncbi:hypothetical protein [Streptomyces lateritius]|uniref:hypothetical protein n=1 Tax=Streptomyces lateritius TaxID=67313 RepID=UPI0016737D48|nr:hypothetical protein [Streptomyces lateritius]